MIRAPSLICSTILYLICISPRLDLRIESAILHTNQTQVNDNLNMPERPDFFFIVADDLGFSDLSYFGSEI